MKTLTNFAIFFVVLIISSFTVGIVIHEGFHIVTMENPTSLSLRFSPLKLTVCCLEENEIANETQAYFIQLTVMLLWIFIGSAAWDREE